MPGQCVAEIAAAEQAEHLDCVLPGCLAASGSPRTV
jgi:hypothetical protein